MKTRRYAMVLSVLALATASVAASAGNYTLSNTTAIQIPDAPVIDPVGHPSSPYGTTINIAGATGTITDVSVTLNGFSHSFPGDLGIMLVGPGGQQVMLMGRLIESSAANSVTLTFNANAASPVVPSVSGTYLPAYISSEPFPAPAPAVTGNVDLNVFDGTAANGTWSLFVTDQATEDSGGIAGGWTLNVVTYAPTTCASEGYTSTKLTWCRNICEMGYTGATLDMWIHRWVNRYRDLPYCAKDGEEPELPPSD